MNIENINNITVVEPNEAMVLHKSVHKMVAGYVCMISKRTCKSWKDKYRQKP